MRVYVRHGVHRAWDALVPCVAPLLQPRPLHVPTLQPVLLVARRRLLESRDGRAEIGNPGDHVYHPVGPHVFPARLRLPCEIHVDPPRVRIPGDLPVEMQTAEDLHADVEPEARSADASRARAPTALLDQRSSTGDVMHPLHRPFRHDLVHVEDDGGGGADDGVAIGILERLQQSPGRRVVVMQRLVLPVRGVHEREMEGTARQEGIQEHGLAQGVKGQQSRELTPGSALACEQGRTGSYMLVGVHAVHPQANLLDEHLHEQDLLRGREVVGAAARRRGRPLDGSV